MRLLYDIILAYDLIGGSISRNSPHRRRDSSGDDDLVRDIDDVRNGLFLQASLHRVLGNHLAFLKVRLFDLMLHMVRN